MRFTHTFARFRAGLILPVLLSLANGCAKNTYTVTKGMAREGYAIWYPAESGIEPGQIWLYDGTLRAKFADRPPTLPLSSPKTVELPIEGLNDAGGTLDTSFTEATISKAGIFAAELNAGTVKSGTYRLGPIQSTSIELGNGLLENSTARYGTGYGKALEMVRGDTPGLLLIAAVITVPQIQYTLYCDDPYTLIARLPRIRDMVHARIDTKQLNEHEIQITLTPLDGALTIGVTPVRGERLLLTTDGARSALGKDLALALKQSYALQVPVPNTISAIEEPVVLPNDSDVQVMTKYRQATAPTTSPAFASTQPATSGRVIVPSPASQPAQQKY